LAVLVSNGKPNSGAAKDALHEISLPRQFHLDAADLECSFTYLCCPVLASISFSSALFFFPAYRGLPSWFPFNPSFSSSRWRGWAHHKADLMDYINKKIVSAVLTYREHKLFPKFVQFG